MICRGESGWLIRGFRDFEGWQPLHRGFQAREATRGPGTSAPVIDKSSTYTSARLVRFQRARARLRPFPDREVVAGGVCARGHFQDDRAAVALTRWQRAIYQWVPFEQLYIFHSGCGSFHGLCSTWELVKDRACTTLLDCQNACRKPQSHTPQTPHLGN